MVFTEFTDNFSCKCLINIISLDIKHYSHDIVDGVTLIRPHPKMKGYKLMADIYIKHPHYDDCRTKEK